MSPSSETPSPSSSARTPAPSTHNPSAQASASARIALWTGWAAAACAGLTTAYFGANYVTARSEALLLRNEAALARTEAQSLTQHLEAERIVSSGYIASLQKSADPAVLAFVRLTAPSVDPSQTAAIAVWNSLTQQGLLIVEKLPALTGDHDYQLWISDPARPDYVSAGTFTVSPDGSARIAFRPDKPTTKAAAFTIRLERKGGAPKPEGPILATGTP